MAHNAFRGLKRMKATTPYNAPVSPGTGQAMPDPFEVWAGEKYGSLEVVFSYGNHNFSMTANDARRLMERFSKALELEPEVVETHEVIETTEFSALVEATIADEIPDLQDFVNWFSNN